MKVKTRKFSKPINLYCFTDIHIGAKDHDKKKFKLAIDALKNDKDGYCFFNGDNLELIPPGYKISESGQEKTVDEQIEEFVNLLKSIKKKVLFFRMGNHEDRVCNLAGVDLGKQVAREVGIPVLHVGMEEFQINVGKRKIRLVSSHGCSASSKKTMTNMQLTFPGADIYFSGHTHEFYFNEGNVSIDTSNGVEEYKHQIEIVGGSFMEWADYARKRNMRPTQTGCYILRLDSSGARMKGKIS